MRSARSLVRGCRRAIRDLRLLLARRASLVRHTPKRRHVDASADRDPARVTARRLHQPGAAPPAPPPHGRRCHVVSATCVISEWIATLDGYVNAQIRPEVTGYLVRRAYQEGAHVRKGQVLFELDPRPFEAAVSQTKAQLAQAEAQLARANRDVERDTPLAAEKAIAQSQLETDIHTQLANRAAVDAATAALETAALNLEFTRVRSLVDGIAAIATAQIGDLVGPTTLLTTVSQVQQPIKAYFPINEKEYLAMADRIRHGQQPWDTNPGPVLILSDGTTYEKGAYLAVDREVDPKTGTIRIAVTFPNPMGLLRPGQYGRVRAVTSTSRHSLVLPQRAIAELQAGGIGTIVQGGGGSGAIVLVQGAPWTDDAQLLPAEPPKSTS